MSRSRHFASVLERAAVNLTPSGLSQCGKPLFLLKLSTRAHNALRRAGVHTIEDAAHWNRADLLRIKNVGESTAEEILKAIARYQNQ